MVLLNNKQRSSNGELLTYTARRLSLNLAYHSLNKLKKNEYYKKIIFCLPVKHVDNYFIKKLYYELYEFCIKLLIYEWNKKQLINDNDNNLKINKMHYDLIKDYGLNLPPYKKIIKSNNLENISIIKRIFVKFNFFLIKLIDFNFFYKQSKYKKIENRIAVNYVEGIDKNKRSDIYWFKHSKIQHSKIIIYFEDYFLMKLTKLLLIKSIML